VAGGGEDGVDGVARGAEQEVAAEVAVVPRVADHRLDGAAAAQLAADGRCDAAPRAGDEDVVLVGVAAAVAAVDMGALDPGAGDALGPGDLRGQRMPVMGIARQGAGAEEELPSGCDRVGGGEGDSVEAWI